jgi:DNA mismatch repair protein MutL
MTPIRVLPVDLVNRIAAGEVVERPASVVKELVENAIDAGASRIEIAVADGGRKLISVSDDGGGMSADDLALAFAPHATSKIATDDDLLAVSTMGFRGEALASIASISHATIRTRRRDDDSGQEISASGGRIGEMRPCVAPPGTTVAIRDLFFNTPARRKFLRTANTEMGHVTEQLTRLAMSHAPITFVLTHNGREVQNLPAAESTSRRIGDLLGAELAGTLVPLARRGGSIAVEGLIAPPSAARATGKWQYFFLNGRYIRDRVLSHALREAYRGLTDPSRFPAGFIFIRMDPSEVDVNVHPTKIEVRFRDSQAVHGELLAALKETLNKARLAPSASLEGATVDAAPGEPEPEEQPPAEGGPAEQHRESLRQALADFFRSAPAPQPRLDFREGPPAPAGRTHSPDAGFALSPPEPPAGYSPRRDLAAGAPHEPPPPHRRAMQVHDAYIVVDCDDGLEIVDQHALHERLLYNDMKRRLADRDDKLTSQRLLIPETLSVTASEAATLDENSALLARMGLEVVPFGPAAVAVQQFPSLLAERGVVASEFVRDLLDLLGDDGPVGPEQAMESVLEMMACKAAVKAGDPLTAAEIDSLLARRDQADKSLSCPHGRPTTLRLTLKDLARQFKRT